ncbi:MAG TPA: homoserine dehydrogenase [Alphaproteobacteria bacterium]|nr:homoserine dehydrogenase [Alphaproteobacteria bacterium]
MALDRSVSMKSLRIAIAGLGTVGGGTLALLTRNAVLLTERCGSSLDVVAVSARDRKRERAAPLANIEWYDDAVEMARESDADVVVELIGGSDGVAKSVIETALDRRKHVVTANKALLAHHGAVLAEKAERAGVSLNYEAAVAGGIPIVKALRESLAGNRIERVYGILNGTCNYILTDMRRSGREFAAALADAQRLGYAETDPSFDVDGVDAAHKLAILASLAFGTKVNFAGVHMEGIRHVSPHDIAYAEELGYRIKLIGSARLTDHGLEQRVHPCMVSLQTPLAHVEGVLNAVVAKGDFVETTEYEGRGAGAGPTASAVVADLVDIALGRRAPTFGVPASQLKAIKPAPMARHYGAYYVRLMVVDRPGVIADIAAALRDQQVSMEAMIQRGRAPDATVPVVLTTHETEEAAMRRALDQIGALDSMREPPRMIRIEPL